MKSGTIRLLLAGFLLTWLSFAGCVTGSDKKETARLYYNLGNAYGELGKNSEAGKAYESAWTIDPSLFQAGYNLARLHIAAGRISQGRTLLESLLAKEPENAILLEALAWSYYLERDDKRALEIYTQILEIQPGNQHALYNSSRIWIHREEWERASELLMSLYRAEKSSPGIPAKNDLLLEAAELSFRSGNPEAALESLLYLKEKAPSQKVFTLLGDIYNQKGLYGDALEAYRSIPGDEETAPEVLYRIAVILLTVIEDVAAGLEALGSALEGGYENTREFQDLLARPDFLFADEVKNLFIQKNIPWDNEEAAPLDELPEEESF